MSELYHHGILGQKWGKRNGPPYPISPGDHSAAEKKAALTDKQKKVIKTTAVIIGGAALAAIGGVTIATIVKDQRVSIGRNAVDAIVGSGRIELGSEIPNSGGFRKFAKGMPPTHEEIVAQALEANKTIRAENDRFEPCTNIFMQTVCQSQGIDAIAGRPKGANGNRLSDVIDCFKGGADRTLYEPSSTKINQDSDGWFASKNFPNGSYGFISAGIMQRNGQVAQHMFRWDIEDGHVKYSNGVYGDASVYIGHLVDYKDQQGVHRASIMRVDDMELDWDRINNLDIVRPNIVK